MAARFKPCSVAGCNGNSHYSEGGKRGWCRAHYLRWYRHGDPLEGIASPGTKLQWLRAHAQHTGDDCLVWPFGSMPNGYGNCWFEGRVQAAHRVMCVIAHGMPPEPTDDAAHKCRNGAAGCVNPKHVTWKTRSGNQMDRVRDGTSNRGSAHGSSKLSEDDVREIRALRGILSQKAISERFGISNAYVCSLQKRRTWAWLD